MEHECNSDLLRGLRKYQGWAPTVLRIFFGFFFMMHGTGKLWGVGLGGGLEGWMGFASSLGIPSFFAHIAPWIEFIVGILLIIGLWVRYASVLGGIQMIVAAVLSHLPKGFLTAELPLLFLGAFIALLLTGPGKCSLEGLIAKKRNKK